jgi:hypothetical protein
VRFLAAFIALIDFSFLVQAQSAQQECVLSAPKVCALHVLQDEAGIVASPGRGTGRFWPHGTGTWPDGQSMPSEHAMNVWAFAHVIGAQYNGIATRTIVYSLATTVSVSRVIARQHFPSDVIVGSVFGYLIGGYVQHRRSRESEYFSLSSIVTPNGRGIQLTYNFAH